MDNYTYVFFVPGKPFGKQRPRVTGSGHAYTPVDTVNYENLVKVCFTEKYPDIEPTENYLTMEIVAHFPIPTSWSKKKKRQAIDSEIFPHKPDWDNIGKIISDALNGIAYKDDAQICHCSVHKCYADKPMVGVFITVIGG